MKVSPEWIIDQNPPVYIKVATHANMADAENRYNAITSRTGFSGIKAIADNRLWLIDSGITYGPRCFAGAASFAKMLYPDEFKDLSVEEMLKDYNKRYSLNLLGRNKDIQARHPRRRTCSRTEDCLGQHFRKVKIQCAHKRRFCGIYQK